MSMNIWRIVWFDRVFRHWCTEAVMCSFGSTAEVRARARVLDVKGMVTPGSMLITRRTRKHDRIHRWCDERTPKK